MAKKNADGALITPISVVARSDLRQGVPFCRTVLVADELASRQLREEKWCEEFCVLKQPVMGDWIVERYVLRKLCVGVRRLMLRIQQNGLVAGGDFNCGRLAGRDRLDRQGYA